MLEFQIAWNLGQPCTEVYDIQAAFADILDQSQAVFWQQIRVSLYRQRNTTRGEPLVSYRIRPTAHIHAHCVHIQFPFRLGRVVDHSKFMFSLSSAYLVFGYLGLLG